MTTKQEMKKREKCHELRESSKCPENCAKCPYAYVISFKVGKVLQWPMKDCGLLKFVQCSMITENQCGQILKHGIMVAIHYAINKHKSEYSNKRLKKSVRKKIVEG